MDELQAKLIAEKVAEQIPFGDGQDRAEREVTDILRTSVPAIESYRLIQASDTEKRFLAIGDSHIWEIVASATTGWPVEINSFSRNGAWTVKTTAEFKYVVGASQMNRTCTFTLAEPHAEFSISTAQMLGGRTGDYAQDDDAQFVAALMRALGFGEVDEMIAASPVVA